MMINLLPLKYKIYQLENDIISLKIGKLLLLLLIIIQLHFTLYYTTNLNVPTKYRLHSWTHVQCNEIQVSDSAQFQFIGIPRPL